MKLRLTIKSYEINIAIFNIINIKNNNVDNLIVIILILVYIINKL